MKKTLVSLAAAAALTTGAMAADKGIDIVTTGQAVVYYETNDNNGKALQGRDAGGNAMFEDKTKLFDQKSSKANVGVQLNLGADLGNNFTFGSQLSYLGTAGLEKNLVGNTMQTAGDLYNTTNEIALTKIFVAKKIGNTTAKVGRMELPKSLSPLAYTEGWDVFKNTFESILVVNSDIPDTILVGAYVGKGSGHNLGGMGDPVAMSSVKDDNGKNIGFSAMKTAYMLTAQNKSVPMTTITASYYAISGIGASDTTVATTEAGWAIDQTTGVNAFSPATVTGTPGTAGAHADALWLDVAVAGKDLPLGIKIGLQAGQISPDSNLKDTAGTVVTKLSDTTAYGVKFDMAPVSGLTFGLAYTSVDGADVNQPEVEVDGVDYSNNSVAFAMKNFGTGVKSPLYTQMVANQDAISLDADTFQIKVAYNTGDWGTIGLAYSMTSAGDSNMNQTYSEYFAMDGSRMEQQAGNDYTELDLVYKIKAAGVQYFVAYVRSDWDRNVGSETTSVPVDADAMWKSWAATRTIENSQGKNDNNKVRFWARYAF